MRAVGLRDVQESLTSSVATAYLALVDRSSLPAAVPCRFAARSMKVVIAGAVSPPLARLARGHVASACCAGHSVEGSAGSVSRAPIPLGPMPCRMPSDMTRLVPSLLAAAAALAPAAGITCSLMRDVPSALS